MPNTVRVVMPPDGEEWGFPKPCPSFKTRNDFIKWMLSQGFPQEKVDQLNYCKFYDEEI